MADLKEVTIVCKEFARQLPKSFAKTMGKSYEEVKDDKEYVDFFNRFHENIKNDKNAKYPEVVQEDYAWFNTEYKKMNGKEPNESMVFKYLDESVFVEEDGDIGFGLFD